MNQNLMIEYRVVQVQFSRVTFVNGQWDGQVPPQNEKALESCVYVWDYLNRAGADGWRLVQAVSTSESNSAQLLYLAREQ